LCEPCGNKRVRVIRTVVRWDEKIRCLICIPLCDQVS